MKRSGGNVETPISKRMKTNKSENYWWEEQLEDTSVKKWSTLEHHGVLFPPEYTPHQIPLHYDGQPVELTPEQEEVSTWWSQVIGTDWETKPILRSNFQTKFLELFDANSVVKDLSRCDFSKITEHMASQREIRKARPNEEKKAEREAKLKQDEAMGYAIVDGMREKMSNYTVEPPGLFRGRGEHPKAGYLKTRLSPEDVTMNVGKGNIVPKCPIPGHSWKNVVHNDTVTWLAYFKDPHLNFSNVKYVYLSASSKFKGLNDKIKYEKARTLKSLIEGIRQDYTERIQGDDRLERQLGTALYLIDCLALRVGNEKSEDEADTVGCCSLRAEHISFPEANTITLDFLGKDSMRYFNTVKVSPAVFKSLKQSYQGKAPTDELFELISTNSLNDYLKSFMPKLSAKVFRTFNASVTLQQELSKCRGNPSVDEKVQFYTDANREVAILCNHQKSTPKNFGEQMEKLQDKLKDKLEKLAILEDNLARFKRDPAYMPRAEDKLPTNEESTRKAISRQKATVKNMEIKLKMKDDNKTVALGTSKINYMDPRITVTWCKRNEVPIEKVFPKTLRAKFIWAMYAEPEWEF
jgi:DNA topoisomerase-1